MSLGYDIPNARNISPSITVSKPSDSIGTLDVYIKQAATVTNLFQPLKLSTDEVKKGMAEVVKGLTNAQQLSKTALGFVNNNSIFKKAADGSLKLDPAGLIKGLMKIDPKVSNAIKGFLDVASTKILGTIKGAISMVSGIVNNLKNIKANVVSSVFNAFNSITGAALNFKILDKGPLHAGMMLIFGESIKNKITGMWGQFKNVDLFETIGQSVTRSLSKLIVKYGDVDLLKDISEDAYKYALLEGDSRLLYNFAANYKLPAGADNKTINEIFTKFDTAANNLRPNWAYVTVNGQEQIDGYFITYGSADFAKLISAYVNFNAVTKYNEDIILANGGIMDVNNPYVITVSMSSAMRSASALHGLAQSQSLAKVTTKMQIETLFQVKI